MLDQLQRMSGRGGGVTITSSLRGAWGNCLTKDHQATSHRILMHRRPITLSPQSTSLVPRAAKPACLPSLTRPEVQMDCSPFTASEIARVIKKIKSSSAPPPFDTIGYMKCLFLHWSTSSMSVAPNHQCSINGRRQQSGLLQRNQQLRMPQS